MFKLVAVGGKLRGKEIVLNEGENTICLLYTSDAADE